LFERPFSNYVFIYNSRNRIWESNRRRIILRHLVKYKQSFHRVERNHENETESLH
jgi:hypothetical protein